MHVPKFALEITRIEKQRVIQKFGSDGFDSTLNKRMTLRNTCYTFDFLYLEDAKIRFPSMKKNRGSLSELRYFGSGLPEIMLLNITQ